MKIELENYNSAWPDAFEKEKGILLNVAGEWLCGAVEHVGSTSVPGLSAKPIIDIMFGVKDLPSSKPAIEALSVINYCYYPYKDDVMHWFCKPKPEYRTHHLHLIPFKSNLWQERLKFRDILRNNRTIAQKYAALKQKLAQDNPQDREAYTENKWPFIKAVLSGRIRS
ncbi:GrpB family protein [Microbulbifer sp. TRSA002]|uniref:GrpB family protein n=1 Tax=Microbulbifer sp. TRSA002 TaxID=3243382 RepID=UPI00403A44D3